MKKPLLILAVIALGAINAADLVIPLVAGSFGPLLYFITAKEKS